MSGTRWLSLWLIAGCATPFYGFDPYGDTKDTDVAVDSDTDVVVDTDVPEDTPDTPAPPEDSAWWLTDDSDEPADTVDTTPPLTGLGCHPFDPVDSAPGWVRRYSATFGRDRGMEIQTGIGQDTIPAGWAGPTATGWAYDTEVVNAGDANYEGRSWYVCDHGAQLGAFDIGWTKTVMGGLLGRTPITVRAAARQPRRYLPGDADMIGGFPNWSENMRYDLTQDGGTIVPGGSQAELHHDGTYVGFGLESVTVPAGTFDAVHLVVSYTEEKASAGGLMDAFFGVFDALFASVFGFANGETSVTVESHRWYVRGIGLVKESTVDIAGAAISEHELTRCSGLPGCP